MNIDFLPIGDRICVLRDKAPDKSEGGVIIPVVAQEKPLEGTVVALGSSSTHGFTVLPGDRVLFSAYTGLKVQVGQETDDYLVMREDELLGVRRASASRNGASVKAAREHAR